MGERIGPGALALLIFAWGSGPAVAEDPATPQPVVHLAGMYEVKGVTVVKATGDRREIKGTVILAQEGDSYTSTFDLTTVFPFVDATVEADVIGTGEGKIEGRSLRGTARTQIVMSTVPGIDPSFAFVPRTVGPRLVSTNVGRLEEDGSITLEIENVPAEGESYSPTHTTLRGVRVGKGPSVDSPPADASKPASEGNGQP